MRAKLTKNLSLTVFQQFLHHIERNALFTRRDKILLAVSGGLDSMVMLHLFKAAGFTVGVAHCNFQMRGEDSKADEALVNTTCVEHNISFHLMRFETEKHADEKGLSIQMAARELRYNFFNELLDLHHYNYIATAHHLNDSLETVLLNLVRGTGIDGVTGIPLTSGKIIRPLLFASREEINDYATFHRLSWREDASNASDKYQRNLLRNQVIPLLKTLNPDLEHTVSDTLERLKGTSSLQKLALHHFRQAAIEERDDQLRINLKMLQQQPFAAVTLWEVVKDKGFSYTQSKDIVNDAHQSGTVFYSASHQLTIDRDGIIITLKNSPTESLDVTIEDTSAIAIRGKETLTLHTINHQQFILDKDPMSAQLDFEAVSFPLTWRQWRPGDSFVPLGMKQRKKISDFLIDIKMPLPEKESVTVLESKGEIVWLVGHRIANPFKVNDKTSRVLRVKLAK